MSADLTPGLDRRAALVLAIVALSFAGPFFRAAEPTHPLVAAGLRLAMASLVLLPLAVRAHRRGRLSRAQIRGGLLAGAFYGLHFGSWVWSLGLTSMAASVTLVTATPLLLALVGVATGRDRPTPRLWAGIGLATAGVLIIGGSHLTLDGPALLGDALAFLGAAAMAGYLLVVRRLSATGEAPDPFGFTGIAAATGAVLLLGTGALLGHPPLPASAAALGWLALAALVPQLIGHSLLTWSLRFVGPATVGLATVGEPVGSSLIAWLWFGEAITGQVALGSVVILVGVVVALRRA